MKKKMLVRFLLLALALTMLTACGKDKKNKKTLEEFYASEEVQEKLAENMKAVSPQYYYYYSNVEIEVVGNEMIYKYTYRNNKVLDQESLSDALGPQAAELIQKLGKNTGVTDDITIRYIYYNPDGTEIANVAFYDKYQPPKMN